MYRIWHDTQCDTFLTIPYCPLRWATCPLKWATRLGTFPATYLVDETILYQNVMTNRVQGSEMIVSESKISQD